MMWVGVSQLHHCNKINYGGTRLRNQLSAPTRKLAAHVLPCLPLRKWPKIGREKDREGERKKHREVKRERERASRGRMEMEIARKRSRTYGNLVCITYARVDVGGVGGS